MDWHRIPPTYRQHDLPAHGTRVVVRAKDPPDERQARWDGGAREWWGSRIDGRIVDWRASMAAFDEWREQERSEDE